jgi:hypothetical protein
VARTGAEQLQPAPPPGALPHILKFEHQQAVATAATCSSRRIPAAPVSSVVLVSPPSG